MYLYKPLTFKPDSNAISITPEPNFVKVIKTEEKGSDVNLGVHLVRDALTGKFFSFPRGRGGKRTLIIGVGCAKCRGNEVNFIMTA
jgi:hypothetical protein